MHNPHFTFWNWGNAFFNWQEVDTKKIISTDTDLKRADIRWWLLPWERHRDHKSIWSCIYSRAGKRNIVTKVRREGGTGTKHSYHWERTPRLQIAQRAKNNLMKHSSLIESLHGGELSSIDPACAASNTAACVPLSIAFIVRAPSKDAAKFLWLPWTRNPELYTYDWFTGKRGRAVALVIMWRRD